MRSLVPFLCLSLLLSASAVLAGSEPAGHSGTDNHHDGDKEHHDEDHESHTDEDHAKSGKLSGVVWPWDGVFPLASGQSVWWSKKASFSVAFFKVNESLPVEASQAELVEFANKTRYALQSSESTAQKLFRFYAKGSEGFKLNSTVPGASGEPSGETTVARRAEEEGHAEDADHHEEHENEGNYTFVDLTDTAFPGFTIVLAPNASVVYNIRLESCNSTCAILITVPETGYFYLSGNVSASNDSMPPYEPYLWSRSGKLEALPWSANSSSAPDVDDMHKARELTPQMWGNAFAGVFVAWIAVSFFCS
jgi:hypothetical protein